MRRPFAIAAWLSVAVLSMLCGGCVTPDANPMEYEVGASFDVALVAPSLKFSGDALAVPQEGPGVTVNLGVRDSLPQLYYRYRVRGEVNGTYFAMPAPPMLYHIYREPYYKLVPPNMAVRFSITNTSNDVLYMGKTSCAFDMGGKTIVSVPLTGPDILPGHTGSFALDGPDLEQFKQVPQGSITVWLYGVGGAGHPYHWDLTYQYSEVTSTGHGIYEGKTVRDSVAKSYEGREERAETSSNPSPTPP